jgi:hypothetical protein
MSTPTLDQMVRRLIGAAFDAGVAAAGRPAAKRADAREDQAAYAVTILTAHCAAEVARQAKEPA